MRDVRHRVTTWVVAALLGATMVGTPLSIAGESGHGEHGGHGKAPKRVGVLVMDHGEPPVYNEDTYWSFRAFIDHLMQMEVIPSWLRTLDLGTVLQDAGCYACPEPRDGAKYIDAWLKPHSTPAVFVPQSSDSLPPHYVLPGGPGLGEPDIFEHAGLQIWDEWRRMGGRSPNYDEKLAKKRVLIQRLRRTYGDAIPIRTGYGIDPRIGGVHQGIKQAVEALVNRDRVDGIVALYHGVGFSDIMQTHMLRHDVHETLDELGAKVSVRFARPLGVSGHYTVATVEKVKQELARVPNDAPVAVHLSGHGLPTTTCGGYDCGKDAYHTSAKKLFERTSKAVRAAVDRPGRFGVFSVFADGSEGDVDPEDRVDSPLEGLAKRKREGFRYVIDVPYEFDSNSRDTLIVLRHAYHRTIPDWNARYESSFTVDGVRVKIANANGAEGHKIDAFEAVARAALAGWAKTSGTSGRAGHDDQHAAATAGAPSATHGDGPHTTSTRAPLVHDVTRERAADDVRDHTTAVSSTTQGIHALPVPLMPGKGIPIVVAGLAVLALAALGVSIGRFGAPLRSRIVLGAAGIQFAGFAWDGWLHHRSGHPLSWFENAGHVTVLLGLAIAVFVSFEMVRAAQSDRH